MYKPGKVASYYYPQLQLNMWLMNLKHADFVQYIPRTDWLIKERIDILRVDYNHEWMMKAWQEVQGVWAMIRHLRANKGNTAIPVSLHTPIVTPQELTALFHECVEDMSKKKSGSSDTVVLKKLKFAAE